LKRKAIFLLYRVLEALLSPLILIYLLRRGFASRPYRASLGERFGGLPPSLQQTVSASIWLHAVSVGEVLAAIPLLEELKARSPQTPLFVSVTTLAGRETAEKRLSGLAGGIFYAPFDFVWCVRRVLRRLRPTVVVILETEIWPNLFREVNRLGCSLILVNGRISDRAWPRYRKFRPLFGEVLSLCDRVLVQSEAMKQRFESAGAPAAVTEAAGNLKYDFRPGQLDPASPVLNFIRASSKPIWIAASTSADAQLAEEDAVIAAQRELPGWRLILAPRQPGRFAEVAAKLSESGFRWTRRTALDAPDADVLLLDSIGELSGVFASATVVFMGGTLADRGGHNILEPAVHGKPVIAGPHLENFRDMEEHFEAMGALPRIASGSELKAALLRAAADPLLGERARAAAEAQRGAARRAADRVLELYEARYPVERPPQPVYAILAAFAWLWKLGSARDRRRKLARTRQLPVPVLSIGNVTAGGTGKTPTAIELLRQFQDLHPGLLSRGHGRSTSHTVLLLSRDEGVPTAFTGDEPQLIRQSVVAPIGIGADRFEAGGELLRAEPCGLLILDDGFQHLQLHRDFDVVLIDGLRPFGGGHLLPLGRLREPLEGLARAQAFLITRAGEAPNLRAIEATIRRYNAVAPIYYARLRALRWRDSGGFAHPLDALKDARAVAFCGLGNPESFWRTLARLGVEPLSRYEYSDHHAYRPPEIRRLAQHARDLGADTLVTTAKDAVNLDPGYPDIIAPLRLCWLEIGIDLDPEFHAELRSGILNCQTSHHQTARGS
jgi:tetraacyldisaccharide 4'-kinase